MSEVKRIFLPGFTELPDCGDRCWSSAIDVDQWGARIEVYGMTSAEATELRDEVLNAIVDFDAQRLRADTAEAAREEMGKSILLWTDRACVYRDELAAAEQRIADISVILSRIIEVQKTDYSVRGGLPHRWECLIAEAESALNPKPEAESHE